MSQLADLAAIWQGGTGVAPVGHLAVAPVPSWWALDQITEASWRGYSPAPMTDVEIVPTGVGPVFVGGQIAFDNPGPDAQHPIALYFTFAGPRGNNLIGVIQLPSGPLGPVPSGGISWGVVFQLLPSD